MVRQPASCNWSANQPSDKMSTSPSQVLGEGQVDILLDDHPATHPPNCNWPANHPSDKMSADPNSDLEGVSIFHINTQVAFCEMANQPAAIGQPTSHLTKCQPDPKSQLEGTI